MCRTAERALPQRERGQVARTLVRTGSNRTVLPDAIRRRLEQPDEVPAAAGDRQPLRPRQQRVQAMAPLEPLHPDLLPDDGRPPLDLVALSHKLIRVPGKDDELVPPHGAQRLDGVALDARDALSVRRYRRRVDAEPSHGRAPWRGRRRCAGGSSSRAAAAHAPTAEARAADTAAPTRARARRRSTRRRRGTRCGDPRPRPAARTRRGTRRRTARSRAPSRAALRPTSTRNARGRSQAWLRSASSFPAPAAPGSGRTRSRRSSTRLPRTARRARRPAG